MSANPADHVKDNTVWGISESGGLLSPTKSGEGHNATVDWGGQFLGGPDAPVFVTIHSFSLILMAVILLFGAIRAARQIKMRPPEGRGANAQLFETLIKFLRDDIARPNLGPHGAKYTPFVITFFFFILVANLIGMVPLGISTTSTSNFNVTAALATIVLFSLFFFGIKEQGVIPFFKNIVPAGIPWLLWPPLFALELAGPFIKCFALSIRLVANMVAGHIVLSSMIGLGMTASGEISYVGLVPAYGMALGISILEIFVAFLQAYVFTLLSTIFLGSFIHPEH